MPTENPERPSTPDQEEIGRLQEKIDQLENKIHVLTEKNKELERQALIDPLTETYNPRGLKKMAEVLLPRDENERSIAIAMFDLDDFKKFNTEYGHLKANEVLKGAAEVLKRSIREHDVVARFGGEEFVVIFTDTTGEDIKERFFDESTGRAQVGFTTLIDGEEIRVSFSGGVTEVKPGESVKDFKNILERANLAMRKAKESGKDQIAHFTEGDASSLE